MKPSINKALLFVVTAMTLGSSASFADGPNPQQMMGPNNDAATAQQMDWRRHGGPWRPGPRHWCYWHPWAPRCR